MACRGNCCKQNFSFGTVSIVLSKNVSLASQQVVCASTRNRSILFVSCKIRASLEKYKFTYRRCIDWVDCCWVYVKLTIWFLTGDAQTTFWSGKLVYWCKIWFLSRKSHFWDSAMGKFLCMGLLTFCHSWKEMREDIFYVLYKVIINHCV